MICWSLRWSRQKQDHAVRSVSALPHAAIASLLAWWQTCPAQACVYNFSCMCVGSFVTRLTASGRSRRERLPAFVLPWARLTVRRGLALQSLGLATCAELGTRLAERLALQTSPTTILRRLMVLPTAAREQVSELGRDDFSHLTWEKIR